MKKGSILFLSALVLFGLCAFTSTTVQAAPSPITVDCSTSGALQAALDGHGGGYTFVISGTCNENVNIRQPGTVLDGLGTGAIHGPDTTTMPAIQSYSIGVVIKNLTITGGFQGVLSVAGGNTTILNNTFSGSGAYGIHVTEGGTARILGNTITNQPRYGIFVADNGEAKIGFSHGWDVAPTANTITGNGTDVSQPGGGIGVTRSSSARIVGNTISNNGSNGITVSKVSHADISYNTIEKNAGNGITVYGDSGVNLGTYTVPASTDMYSLPNITRASTKSVNYKNAQFGVACSAGGYVDGRRGTLTGVSGAVSVATGCLNLTHP